jgi:hypothetical protein
MRFLHIKMSSYNVTHTEDCQFVGRWIHAENSYYGPLLQFFSSSKCAIQKKGVYLHFIIST